MPTYSNLSNLEDLLVGSIFPSEKPPRRLARLGSRRRVPRRHGEPGAAEALAGHLLGLDGPSQRSSGSVKNRKTGTAGTGATGSCGSHGNLGLPWLHGGFLRDFVYSLFRFSFFWFFRFLVHSLFRSFSFSFFCPRLIGGASKNTAVCSPAKG